MLIWIVKLLQTKVIGASMGSSGYGDGVIYIETSPWVEVYKIH